MTEIQLMWTTYDDFVRSTSHSHFFKAADRGRFIRLSELIKYTKENRNFQRRLKNNSLLQQKINFWENIASDNRFIEDEGLSESHKGKTVASKFKLLKTNEVGG